MSDMDTFEPGRVRQPHEDDGVLDFLKLAAGDDMLGKPDPSTLDSYGDPIPTGFTPEVFSLSVPGYEALARVLRLSYEQSAQGKGAERHANALPFHQQPIMQNGRSFGEGFAMGQATKKLQEAAGMVRRQSFEAARREILGTIVYAAAAYLLIEEYEDAP